MPLPTPGGSKDKWGKMLNFFLRKSHTEDGDLLPEVISEIRQGLADGADLAALEGEVEVIGDDLIVEKGKIAIAEGEISRINTREFDVRKYGASHLAADNIDFINDAILDAYNNGGGRVVVPTGKTFGVMPSLTHRIIARSGVTLDLGDATLKVDSGSDPYLCLISGITTGTLLRRFTLRGGLIDQNPDGHEGADVKPGHNAITLLSHNYDRVYVDGVSFISIGRNTISLNAVAGRRARITDSDITWQQGASGTPNYDNSAIYLVGTGFQVVDCDFETTIEDQARACLEMHGSQGVMTGCNVKGFQTLANLTPSTGAIANPGHMTVADNTLVDGVMGVQTWLFEGRAMRDVQVHHNNLHLNPVPHDLNSSNGITLKRGTPGHEYGGSLDGYIVDHNMIRYESDTRTVTTGGTAMAPLSTYGINTAEVHDLYNTSITDNWVIGAPGIGLKIGTSDFAGVVRNLEARRNQLIDCGSNPNLDATTRASIYLAGELHGVTVTDNSIRDTGASALIGNYAVRANAVSSASTAVIAKRNPITTATGSLLESYGSYVQTHWATVAHDFGSIAAGATSNLDVTVLGARAGDFIEVQPVGSMEVGLDYYALVASDNTVRMVVTNRTAAAIDPANRNYRFRINKRGLDY